MIERPCNGPGTEKLSNHVTTVIRSITALHSPSVCIIGCLTMVNRAENAEDLDSEKEAVGTLYPGSNLSFRIIFELECSPR